MMRLLITRPEPDASKLSVRLNALGFETVVEPLLRIEQVESDLSLNGVGALIVTSRNALRAVAGFEQLSDLLLYPVFAVGRATAALASDIGFAQVIEGDGAARDLPDLIARHSDLFQGDLLHLSAEEVAYDLEPELASLGLCLLRKVVYSVTSMQCLSVKTAGLLEQGMIDGVILMSPKTSRIWAMLAARVGISAGAAYPVAFCISAEAASPLAKLENVSIRIAKKPNIEDLLALILEAKNKSG